jgi:hypothetical protein
MKRNLVLVGLIFALFLVGRTDNPAHVSAISNSHEPGDKFKATCTHPRFPDGAVAVDNQCGNAGNGGDEAEQNSIKNNFCPLTQQPTAVTISKLTQLQARVEKNEDINFGTGKAGPTKDRSPLKPMGEGRLVSFKGYVLTARQEGGESVNCKYNGVPDEDPFHDIHISLVTRPNNAVKGDTKDVLDQKECTGIVAEMSPHHRPETWTEGAVKKVAGAKAYVRVTGQQFFDSSHVPCKEGKPVGKNPKRVSLWEIHPIYTFEVCISNCNGAGTWQTLDKWLQTH